MARYLKTKTGAKIYLTRKRDKYLTLEQRNAFAVSNKADIFISVHANASTNPAMTGIETYYLNNATDKAAEKLARRENAASHKKLSDEEHILSTMLQNVNTEESKTLALHVQGSLMKKMKSNYKNVKDRQLRSALFYVLVGAKCPAILVETSFISNKTEEERLLDPKYQESVAAAIAEGVQTYIKKNENYLAFR
jgi:N-acetylmuramoyl-L-alanine amidase